VPLFFPPNAGKKPGKWRYFSRQMPGKIVRSTGVSHMEVSFSRYSFVLCTRYPMRFDMNNFSQRAMLARFKTWFNVTGKASTQYESCVAGPRGKYKKSKRYL
jgi:hypothetical protein